MGGTFPALSKEYQEEFIKGALKAMNDFSLLFYENDEFQYKKFKEIMPELFPGCFVQVVGVGFHVNKVYK